MKKTLILIIAIAVIMTSCSDVQIEDHIEGTWQLEMYLRNDVDETSEVKISNYEETYTIDGTFSRSYINDEQTPVEENGTYSISEDNSTIHISGVSSISNFTAANSSISTSTIDVIMIDKTEYAYSFENGGDKHEFRFLIKE